MIRRILPLSGIIAGALLLAPSTGMAAQGFGGCELDGNANFAAPLGTTSVDTTYDFSGTLSNCAGSDSDTGGTVSAGQDVTINGTIYHGLGRPTLSGGCSNSTTSGKAFVDWGAGKYSVIDYDTTGAAAAVVLDGTFESGSVTLASVATDPQTGAALSTITVPLAYGDDYAGGPLAFEPADPTACAGAGVGSAGIQGFIGHGNYQ